MIDAKLAILSTLNNTVGYPLLVDTIRGEATRHRGHPMGDAEFASALETLTKKGFVSYTVDELTFDKRHQITQAGTAYLNQ